MQKKWIFTASLMISMAAYAADDAVIQGKSESLLDIYQQALAHDPTLASALSANQAAQEIIEQGKALYRPTINFNADANEIQSEQFAFFLICLISSSIVHFGSTETPSSRNTSSTQFELCRMQ